MKHFKYKIKLTTVVEDNQFFVLEQKLSNGEVIDEFRHGPFESVFESELYCEQGTNYLKSKSQLKFAPGKSLLEYHGFLFIFPPP